MITDFMQPDKLMDKQPEKPVENLKRTVTDRIKKQTDESLPNITSAPDKFQTSPSLQPDSVITNLKSNDIDNIGRNSVIPDILPDKVQPDGGDKSTSGLPFFDLCDEFSEPLAYLKETASNALAGLFSTTNRAQFFFSCSAITTSLFDVSKFTGTERLSGLYEFDIVVTTSDTNIDITSLIHKNATFFIKNGNSFNTYSGITTSFSYVSTINKISTYQLTLRPQLWKLNLNKNYRIFQKKSIPAIITDILDENKIFNRSLSFTKTYPELEYTVQYGESDYLFITRLMAQCGIWYTFSNSIIPSLIKSFTPLNETVEFSDATIDTWHPSTLSTVEIRYEKGFSDKADCSTDNHIFRFERDSNIVSEKAVVKNYNYRTPEVDLYCTSPVPQGMKGMIYEYGNNFKNTSEASQYSQILSNRIASDKNIFSGSSYNRSFRAGTLASCKKSGNNGFTEDVLIFHVNHTGMLKSLKGSSGNGHYSNTFSAVSANCTAPYPSEYNPNPSTAHGIINATIESSVSDYVSLDEQGRYKTKLAFDHFKSQLCTSSKYIRMAQPYCGENYGIHFPLHNETEILLAHINDHPDKPIGISSIPNANTLPPVTSNNKEQSVIKTRNGNTFIFDDTAGSESISLIAPNNLSFSSDADQSIKVKNNRSKTVKNDLTRDIAEDYDISVSGDSTVNVHGDSSTTTEGDVLLKVSNDCNDTFKAGLKTTINSDSSTTFKASRYSETASDASITIEGDHKRNVTGNSVFTCKNDIQDTITGDHIIKSGAATFLSAKKISVEGTTSITLEVGGSKVVITTEGIDFSSSGNVITSGRIMNTTGGTICFSGKKININ